MEKREKIVAPKYQQIAADIASKIANGLYKKGDKIYARSSLAIQYGVSSETARRAISILSDLQIVQATKGSGVLIVSQEKAMQYIKQFNDIQTVNEVKTNILQALANQRLENERLEERVLELVDRMDRFQSINPFIPFEIAITAKSAQIGISVSENNFWHQTLATVIAIKRNNELILSPGPMASFQIGDIFYFFGDQNCYERVQNFLYPHESAH